MNIEEKIIERYRFFAQKSPPLIAPNELQMKFSIPQSFGGMHIEYDSNGTFHLLGTDQGQVTWGEEYKELDHLMYRIFSEQAKWKASQTELNSRDGHEDPRKIVFYLAVKIVSKISEEWGTRLKHEFGHILERYPFKNEIDIASASKMDRYGGASNPEHLDHFGIFMSEPGVSWPERSLPGEESDLIYSEYAVLSAIDDVKFAPSAPWFNQPGGGIRMTLPVPVQMLVDRGFLVLTKRHINK